MRAAAESSSDHLSRSCAVDPHEGAAEHELLCRLGLVDAPSEVIFDRLTDLAREVLNVPNALLSIVQPYANRQFFKSVAGPSNTLLAKRQTALSHSFCQHVRASGTPMIVCDARFDPRVADNPSVLDHGVRAYLGYPIHLPDGQPIGALCALDTEPREWSPSQVATLEWLATHVTQTISMISLAEAITASLKVEAETKSGSPSSALLHAPNLDRSSGTTLAAEIWSGIERNEFVPHYQLQVNARTNEVAGAEVLARWKRANGDVLSPAAFLPMATRLGVMHRIERQVVARAVVEAGDFQQRGLHIPELSFNLTFEGLTDPEVVTTLQRVRPAGMKFAFEILESVMIDNEDEDLDFHIDRIREAGFTIGLDDFGSGHASMLALLRINPDFVKIDRNLVAQMTRSRRHKTAIRAIIAMARDCGAKITAEGVETKEQARMLHALGCDVFQGFLFAKPVNADGLSESLMPLPGATDVGRASFMSAKARARNLSVRVSESCGPVSCVRLSSDLPRWDWSQRVDGSEA